MYFQMAEYQEMDMDNDHHPLHCAVCYGVSIDPSGILN